MTVTLALAVAEEDVAIDADSLSFERENNLVRAEGNVTIRRGTEVLRADRVVLHTQTRQAHATGNVVFQHGDLEWAGERLAYNFNTRRWASGEFAAFFEPFHIVAGAAENLPPDEFLLRQSGVTTCALPMGHAHYRVRAGRVRIRPDDRLLAHNAVLYLGRVPVFYAPVWRASLDPDFGFRFEPGYRGRMGTYLLSSYRYRIDQVWRGQTHLDYRSRRGLAAGQDLFWNDPDTRAYAGQLSGYFISDRDPYLDRDPDSFEIDRSRYRLQGQLRHQWTHRDGFLGHLEYVSDAKMREDFFEREYRRTVQPDNFGSYVHRRDGFTFGLLGRMRLNDFYEHVDRLPEATLDVNRRPLGKGPLYYESRNAAAVLSHRHAAVAGLDDVSVTRIDADHRLSWPTRAFGFLNLIPRVGGRATYYSETYRDETIETTVTSWTTNEVVSEAGVTNFVVEGTSETFSEQVRLETGADLRTLFEIGLEISFQAARIWETAPAAWGRGLRHVVEPYANFTFIPEPSLTPDRLYAFDDTDRIDEYHGVAFGVRNILQTKHDQRSHDLLDVNLFSSYRFDADEDALGNVGLRAEARPADHWGLDLTAIYDPHESILNELNARLFYRYAAMWRTEIDYRFRNESSRLVAATIALTPGPNWHYEIYGRYEAETSRLEEHAWFVQRNLDCMAIRTGFSHLPSYVRADGSSQDNEYRVTLEIWLTAFPEMRTGISQRH